LNYSIKKIGRRIVALLCVLMTISAFVIVPSYATEEPTEFGQMYGVVDAESLNVRAYASEDAPVVAELSRYKYVRVNWIEPGWVCVAYNNDGLMGYVSSDYIKVFDGAMPDASSFAGQPAVDLAAQFLGVPYVWGGSSPSGFDCSGLIYYVYGQLGYKLYRVADDQIKKNGIAIPYENLAPGDLVAFSSSPGGSYASHIGMYVGDGMMIHAPHTGDVVRYASIAPGTYYHKRFVGGRRIIY
jgi:cell wall-associated NlpC family hydrolase